VNKYQRSLRLLSGYNPWQQGDYYRWRDGDEVNDRPVGKPQEEGMMNIAASFFLSKKPRFVDPVGKRQTQEGDAC
jgi:hypothetical protein